MVASSLNLVGIIIVVGAACSTLSTETKETGVEIWRTFSIIDAKINRKRAQIAEFYHQEMRESEANWCCQKSPEVHKYPFLRMRSENVANIAMKSPKFNHLV